MSGSMTAARVPTASTMSAPPPQTKVQPPHSTKYYLCLLYSLGGQQTASVVTTAARVATASTRYLPPPAYAPSNQGMTTKSYGGLFMFTLSCRSTAERIGGHAGRPRGPHEHHVSAATPIRPVNPRYA